MRQWDDICIERKNDQDKTKLFKQCYNRGEKLFNLVEFLKDHYEISAVTELVL